MMSSHRHPIPMAYENVPNNPTFLQEIMLIVHVMQNHPLTSPRRITICTF